MSLNDLFKKINSLHGELKSLQPLKVEDENRLWKKFRLEFNWNSNHIEGNTLTYGQTELLLIFDKATGEHEMREYEEMKSHDAAFKMIKELAEENERPLTETFIKQLNEIILVRPFWKDAITNLGQSTRRKIDIGNYKQFPNHVQLSNGEIFHYATPEETPAKMHDLMEFYKVNAANTEVHSVWLAAMMHYKFVCIHPFDDGNGRISRLLMNYILLKNDLPPIVIKSNDKKNYLLALNKADVGDLESFVQYIGEQVIWSLELSIKAAKGLNIDELSDIDKEIALLTKELNQQETVSIPASSEMISKTIGESIFPMLKSIEKKIIEFQDYFHGYARRINCQWKDSYEISLGTQNNDWNEIIIGSHKLLKDKEMQIGNINCNFSLNGFKKTEDAQSIDFGIRVHFNKYNYSIKIDNTESKFTYGKSLSEQEIIQLITPKLKEIVSSIKNMKNNS